MNAYRQLVFTIPLLVGSSAAFAQEHTIEKPAADSYAWNEPGMRSQIGVGVQVGAGMAGFTNNTVRDTINANVVGLWGVHATIGTHIPIGLDLGYVGTAVNITPAGLADTGTLVGTDLEGAVRYNILPHAEWNPYVFAGMGWQRYDVTGATFTRANANIKDKDNLAIFPMGAGLSYRDASGLVADLRGTFRAADNSSLILEPNGSKAPLHTWEASAGLGYEF